MNIFSKLFTNHIIKFTMFVIHLGNNIIKIKVYQRKNSQVEHVLNKIKQVIKWLI